MFNSDQPLSLRWSDLDPNFHLRHSVYYDFATQQRFAILQKLGLTTKTMQEQHFGPVIFREECVFKKEVRLHDTVFVTTKIAKMRADGARWTIQHQFVSAEGRLYAILTVEGDWFDTQARKLASPAPPIVLEVLNALPKTEDFEWVSG